MKIVNNIRRELREISYLAALIGAIFGFMLALAAVVSGGRSNVGYYIIIRPRSAPPVFLIGFGFMVVIAVAAAAYAAALGCKRNARSPRRGSPRIYGTLFFLGMLSSLLCYIPLFLAGHAFFMSLILLLIAGIFCAFTVREFSRLLTCAAAGFAVCELWIIYMLWLNICILILN